MTQKIAHRDSRDFLVNGVNITLWRAAALEEGNPSQGMESKM
jgi:hypothetical protein